MDEIIELIKYFSLYFDYKDKGSGEQAERNKNKLLSLLEAVAREQRESTAESITLSSKSFLYPNDSDEIVEWLKDGGLVTNTLKELL